MGISLWKLLVVLAVVALLFGTARLRNLGADLAAAIRGFRGALRDDDGRDDAAPSARQPGQIESGDEEEGKTS